MVGLVLTGLVRAIARIGAERWFGVDTLGVLTLAMSVAAILTIIGSGGLSPGVTKFISQLRGERDQALASDLSILAARAGVVFSLVGAVVAMVYVSFSDRLGTTPPFEVFAIGTLVMAFGFYLSGKSILYGEDRIRPYVGREVLGSILFAVTLGLAVVLQAPPLIILALSAAYLPVGLTVLRAFRHMGPAKRLPIRSFVGYGIIGAVGSLAGVGFSYMTPIAATYVDALAGAALIGGVLTVLEPLNLLPRAVSLVLLPTISQTNAREGTARSAGSIAVSTAIVAASSAPIFALLIIERSRFLGIFFTSLTGGATLAWFSVAFFTRIVGTPSVAALAALDLRRASIAMWSSLVGFSVAIVVWITVSPAMGVPAIGLGYAIGSSIQVMAPLIVATRRYGVRWGSLWYRVAAAAVVVGVMALLPPKGSTDVLTIALVLGLMTPEVRTVITLLRSAVRRRFA
ncbi:MAG: hypothetical protein GXP34_07360 [Actinobacteria bacterium]|nr:hypothetical protein [Actinomycetota bacterium]